jgi:rhodanese-related sulfurtransferase
MQRNFTWKVVLATGLLLILAAVPLLGACGGDDAPAETPTETPIETPTETPVETPAISAFDAAQTAAFDYVNGSTAWNITAKDLFTLIKDDDDDNDPYIISIRKPEHYALGHVPGAVNISFGDLFKDETLATLPTDQQIVVYCYTGHTGSQTTALLGALGYDASNLLHGMSSWTADVEVAPSRFDPETMRSDYATVTEATVATDTNEFPTLDDVTGDTEDELTLNAIRQYASCKNITASDLFLLINDDDEDNDPFIISVRGAADYALGHIEGAVNLACPVLFDKANLDKLPTDQQIVVYCYTGHSGSQATALLNMLGYDATNLKFGMAAWTADPIVAAKFFNPATACMDYVYEK